jgi:hypothetical protein
VTVRGLLKAVGFVLLAVVGLVFVLVAGTWLAMTEPWYDRMLVQRMNADSHSMPWREETERIADVFPDGMTETAASELLHRNGFACTRRKPSDGWSAQLQCIRETSEFICRGRYAIIIFLSAAHVVTSRAANSYHGCL